MLNYTRSHTFATKRQNIHHPLHRVCRSSQSYSSNGMKDSVLSLDGLYMEKIFSFLSITLSSKASLCGNIEQSPSQAFDHNASKVSLVNMWWSALTHHGMQWSSGFLNQNCNAIACFLHECENVRAVNYHASSPS